MADRLSIGGTQRPGWEILPPMGTARLIEMLADRPSLASIEIGRGVGFVPGHLVPFLLAAALGALRVGGEITLIALDLESALRRPFDLPAMSKYLYDAGGIAVDASPEGLAGEVRRAGFLVDSIERMEGDLYYIRGRKRRASVRLPGPSVIVRSHTFYPWVSTGIVVSKIAHALAADGVDVMGVPEDLAMKIDQCDREINCLIDFDAHPAPGDLVLDFQGPWHMPAVCTRNMAEPMVRHFGYFYHEWQAAPPRIIDMIHASMDEAFFISSFCQEAFVHSGLRIPTTVIPHGYDPKTFYPPKDPKESGEFTFLSVCHQQMRKGTLELIEAFSKEFSPDEPVRLVIKDIEENPFIRYTHLCSHPKITAIMENWDVSKVASEMRRSDAFVMPTYAEGFGMPLLEAKACGLPVITTAWGGQSDFCHPDDTFLIDYDLVCRRDGNERVIHEFPLMWAKPRVSSLRQQMRKVYENADARRLFADRSTKRVQGRTWDESLRPLVEKIKEVLYA